MLNIKKKAIALDLDADYTTIENQLIDLKKQIKILDEFKVSFEEVNKYLLDESFFELLIVDKVLETNNLF